MSLFLVRGKAIIDAERDWCESSKTKEIRLVQAATEVDAVKKFEHAITEEYRSRYESCRIEDIKVNGVIQ